MQMGGRARPRLKTDKKIGKRFLLLTTCHGRLCNCISTNGGMGAQWVYTFPDEGARDVGETCRLKRERVQWETPCGPFCRVLCR